MGGDFGQNHVVLGLAGRAHAGASKVGDVVAFGMQDFETIVHVDFVLKTPQIRFETRRILGILGANNLVDYESRVPMTITAEQKIHARRLAVTDLAKVHSLDGSMQ